MYIVSSATCDELVAPEHGHVETPSGHSVGDTAHYWCDPCYTMTGPQDRVCQANGKWSEMDPICEGEHYTEYSFQMINEIKWASSRENLSSVVCEQQRR